MTTNNRALLSVLHPQRKPFVRSHTFVDGIGPPPYTFFDETQDHLGALFHALYGWQYSLDFDECETGASGLGYLSNLKLFNALGGPISVVPAVASVYGAHGVWSVLGSTSPWQIGARTADMDLRGDFLLTAKVAVVKRSTLDSNGNNGFCVAVGNRTKIPVCPGISCGTNSPNWNVFFGPGPSDAAEYFDTGIPVIDGRFYRLQISRIAGALRFFIDGAEVQINGRPGVCYPYALVGCKFLYVSRRTVGAANEGFLIDAIHLMAQRVTT